jgi:hypothetical protein
VTLVTLGGGWGASPSQMIREASIKSSGRKGPKGHHPPPGPLIFRAREFAVIGRRARQSSVSLPIGSSGGTPSIQPTTRLLAVTGQASRQVFDEGALSCFRATQIASVGLITRISMAPPTLFSLT